MVPGAAAISSADGAVAVDGDEIADVSPAVLDSANEGDDVTLVVRMDDVEDPDGTFGALDTGESIDDLRQSAMADQEPVVDYAERTSGVGVENQLWIANAVVLTVDTSQVDVEELAAIDGVDALHEDFEVEALQVEGDNETSEDGTAFTYGLEQANVGDAWANTRGEGASVAVLDSGVDGDHPDIDVEGFAGVNDNGEFVEYDASEAYDTADHGTHVSGTVVGSNESGEHIGVAPEADLYHGQVLEGGSGSFSTVIAGMQWAVEQDVDVMSMSLGAQGQHIEEFVEPVENARNQGSVVVAASGNHGPDTTSAPGDVPGVVTVGATDVDERVSHFSTGGEVNASAYNETEEDYVVPDVVAPGAGVNSSLPDGEWGEKSGTSMATPHVAGVLALVASADEGGDDLATVEAREDAVLETARETGVSADEPADRYGAGVLDAEAAVAAASPAAVTGEVTDSNGEPIPGASVTAGDASTTTAVDGTYTVDQVAATDVNVTIDAAGYGTQTTAVSVPADGAATVDETFEAAPVYALTMEANETYTLGIPAETDDTIGDVLAGENGEVANGSMHAYNASAGAWETPETNESLSALDALVVSPSEDLTATVNFSTESASLPAATEVETGWNFVAAPERAAAEDAFGVGTADPARSTDTYGEAPSVMVQSEGTEGDGVSTFSTGDDALSPFAGYFLYAEEEGELAGAAASDGSLGDVNADLGIETETLEGTVVDVDGEGIENATVSVTGAPLASGTTDDGAFAIDHVAADTESVEVTIDADGYAERTTSLNAFEAGEVELRPENATYHVEHFDAEIDGESLLVNGEIRNVGSEAGNESVFLGVNQVVVAADAIELGTFELDTGETASISSEIDINDVDSDVPLTLFTEDDFVTTVATGESAEDNDTTRTATATGTIEGPNGPVEGVTVEQTNAPGGQTVTAADDGEIVDETNASGEFELELVFNESGEATVEASGQGLEPRTETVTESELSTASDLELFENVTFAAAAAVNVTDAATNTSAEESALVGEDVNVTADAANAGESDAENQPVELLIDGEVVDETTVAIEGDNTTEVEFVYTATESDVNAENVTIRSYTDSAEADLFVEAEEQDNGTETRTENVSGTIEGPNGPVEGVTVTQQADGSSAALTATENESELPEATTNASGAFELELVFNDTDEVTVEAGGQGLDPRTENVSTDQFEEAGTLSASGVELFENVTFAAAAEVNVTQAETNTSTEDPALVGEDVNVTATVENVGEEDAESQPVELLDGESSVVDETTVAVDAGNTTDLTFDYTAAESDVDVENLTVRTYVDDATADLFVEEEEESAPEAPKALNATVANETPSEVTVEFDSNVTLAAGNASGFEVSGDETAYGFADEEATVDNGTVTLRLDGAVEPGTNVTVAYNAEYENVRDAESDTFVADFTLDAENEVEESNTVELEDAIIENGTLSLAFSDPVEGSGDGFELTGTDATLQPAESQLAASADAADQLAITIDGELEVGDDPGLSYDAESGDIRGADGGEFELGEDVSVDVNATSEVLDNAVVLQPESDDDESGGSTEVLLQFSEAVDIEAASDDQIEGVPGFVIEDPNVNVESVEAAEFDSDEGEVVTSAAFEGNTEWLLTLDNPIYDSPEEDPQLSYDSGNGTVNTSDGGGMDTFVRFDIQYEAGPPTIDRAVAPEEPAEQEQYPEIRLNMSEPVDLRLLDDENAGPDYTEAFTVEGSEEVTVDNVTLDEDGEVIVLGLETFVQPDEDVTVTYEGEGDAQIVGQETGLNAEQLEGDVSFEGVELGLEEAYVPEVESDDETGYQETITLVFSEAVDVANGGDSDESTGVPGFDLENTSVEIEGIQAGELESNSVSASADFEGEEVWDLQLSGVPDQESDLGLNFTSEFGSIESASGEEIDELDSFDVEFEDPPGAERAFVPASASDEIHVAMSEPVEITTNDDQAVVDALQFESDEAPEVTGVSVSEENQSVVVLELATDVAPGDGLTVSYEADSDEGSDFRAIESGEGIMQIDEPVVFDGVELGLEGAQVQLAEGDDAEGHSNQILVGFTLPVDLNPEAHGFSLDDGEPVDNSITGVTVADLGDDEESPFGTAAHSDEPEFETLWMLTAEDSLDETENGDATLSYDAENGSVAAQQGERLDSVDAFEVSFDQGPPSAESAYVENDTRDELVIEMDREVAVEDQTTAREELSVSINSNFEPEQSLIGGESSITTSEDNTTITVGLTQELDATFNGSVSYEPSDNGAGIVTFENEPAEQFDQNIDNRIEPDNVTVTDAYVDPEYDDELVLEFSEPVEGNESGFDIDQDSVDSELTIDGMSDRDLSGNGVTTAEFEGQNALAFVLNRGVDANETFNLTYDADAGNVTSEAGGELALDEPLTVDGPATAPTLETAVVPEEGLSVELTFDENVELRNSGSDNGETYAGFSLGGDYGGGITSAEYADETVTLELGTQVLEEDELLVSYDGEAGNLVNDAGVEPTFTDEEADILVDQPNATDAEAVEQGGAINVTFDREMTVTDASGFTLDGVENVGLNGASADGETVTLDLDGDIAFEDGVSVSYNGQGNVEGAEDGLPSLAFDQNVNTTVDAQEPPTVESVTIPETGDAVNVTFDQNVKVDGDSPAGFTLTNVENADLNGELQEVDGDTVVLDVDGTFSPDETDLALDYGVENEGNVVNEDGIEAETFEDESVVNEVNAPTFESAETNDAGDELTLTFDSEMDVGGTSGLSIEGGEGNADFNGVNDGQGTEVTINIDEPFVPGTEYTISYSPENNGGAIVDENGIEPAESFEDTVTVENTTSQTDSLSASPIEVTP